MTNTCSDAEELGLLLDDVRRAEHHLARAVIRAGRLASSGASERVEGLPLDLLLGLACRLTGADRRTLIAAGETLADLPAVATLFTEGALSWGQVRAITTGAKRLTTAQRNVLDAQVAASATDAFDPDDLVWAARAAADDLRAPRTVERAEQRRRDANFVSIQAALDGGVRLYGEFDAITAAPILNALDAAAGPPAPADPAAAAEAGAEGDAVGGIGVRGGDADAAAAGDGSAPGWSAGSRSRQYAAALAKVAADWLGGYTRRPARPLLIAHVQVSDLTASAAGTVELNVRGPLPRITARLADGLAADADIRAVVFDGAKPLAVSDKLTAATIPTKTRIAVTARDRGCRFPGSQDPPGHSDVHHLVHREHGGDHDPDNLALLSRRHHTLVHHHGWALTLEPDSGQITATRRARTWRSLPRGTPLAPPARHDPDRPA